MAAEARVIGTTEKHTNQNVIFNNDGLRCNNIDNTEECYNYEVRFCCPKSTNDLKGLYW